MHLRSRVFTARYGLSPYIKQTRLVFKGLNWEKNLEKCYIRSIASCGSETWELRKTDHKHLECFDMWSWRTMEQECGTIVWKMKYYMKSGWKEYYTYNKTKATRIGHILRGNCLLKHATEGKIEGTGRRGRRRKQLLDGLAETRGCWKLKTEALDRPLWRSWFGRGYGPFARQTREWLNVTPCRLVNSYQAVESTLLFGRWRKALRSFGTFFPLISNQNTRYSL